MNIKNLIIVYVLTFIVFLIIDLTWLGFIAKGVYKKYLGNLLSDNVNWTAAIIFYMIYIIGILVFAVFPAVNKDSLFTAIALGGFLGFLAYATYDLTNLATLKGWPHAIVYIDIIWGTILTASVSTAGFYVAKLFK